MPRQLNWGRIKKKKKTYVHIDGIGTTIHMQRNEVGPIL